MELLCPGCKHITVVTPEWESDLLKKLDPKYPASTITINCKCGEYQHILKARKL